MPFKTAEVDVPRRRGRPVSLNKRKAVIEAAVVEFGEMGFGNASMDAIALRAKVSKRTLYNRFSSKEALFGAVVTDLMHRISNAATIRYQRDRPLRAQLEAYVRQSIELMRSDDNLKLSRAVVAEHIRAPDLVEPALGTYWKSEYGFTAWVKAACRDGRLDARDAVRASHIFASLMRGTVFWPALLGRGKGESRNLGATIREAIDMFLAYYARTGGRVRRAQS
jgi:TetR/AcrR family transcriptional regulator of autoinduction and epiphytic fitness